MLAMTGCLLPSAPLLVTHRNGGGGGLEGQVSLEFHKDQEEVLQEEASAPQSSDCF